MKKSLCLYLALFAMLTTFAAKAPLSIDQKKVAETETSDAKLIPAEPEKVSPANKFSQLSLSDLQATLGRKLTFKEKISWFLFKKKLIHIDPTEKEIKNANTNAVLGFVFGIAGLFLFALLAIPGVILSNKALAAEKADPGILTKGNKGLAKAGQIIGWIDLALIVVALIIVFAVLASFH